MAACVAFLVVMIGLLAPARARAETSIESYVVTITPDDDGKKAHFALELAYRDKRDDGFKYLGSVSPNGLSVHDSSGAELRSEVSYENRSSQYKATFAVPTPSSTVIVEFDQDLTYVYSWSGRSIVVPWAHEFKVPVGATQVRIIGPFGLHSGDYHCSVGSNGRECEAQAPYPFVVEIPVLWPSLGLNRILAVLAFGVLGALLAGVYRRHRRKLLETRGIYPAVTEEAYPEGVGGYRAPPVLPSAVQVEPELTELDARTLATRAAVSGIGFAAVALSLTMKSSSPLSISTSMALGELVALLCLTQYIMSEESSHVGILVLVGVVGGFLLGDVTGMFVGLGSSVFLCFVVWRAANGNASSGSSSSFWYSNSSSSSCGGGGGGGGCGGGGGGGGGGCGG